MFFVSALRLSEKKTRAFSLSRSIVFPSTYLRVTLRTNRKETLLITPGPGGTPI